MGRRAWGLLAVVAFLAALLLGIYRRAAAPSTAVGSRGPARARMGLLGSAAPVPRGARSLRRIPGAPSRRIAGRVTADRSPVQGAVVRIGVPGDDVELEHAEATTAADGRFDLGVRPGALYIVTAVADDRAPAVATVNLGDPAGSPPPDALELVLDACGPGTRIAGTVRDASGGAIQGATIRQYQARWIGVTSDATGGFTMCASPNERYFSAVVTADGYGSMAFVSAPGSGRRLDVVLVPEAVVVGRVLREPEDTPVADAAIRVTRGYLSDVSTAGGTARTDENGRFRMNSVAPGRYDVSAATEGLWQPDRLEVAVDAGTTADELVIRLRRGSRIAGSVVASGKPVAGARLYFRSRGLLGLGAISQTDGSFVIDGLPPGRQALSTQRHELVSPSSILVDRPEVSGVLVEVRAKGAIRGHVVRESKPVAGAVLSCLADGYDARSGADGSYRCEALDGGDIQIRASDHASGSRGATRTVTLAPGEVKEGIDIELTSAASVDGVVVDEEGAPVADATVVLASGDEQGVATTDGAGHFLAGPLAGERKYRVAVMGRAQDAASASVPFPEIDVPSASAHVAGIRLVFRRERPSSISGRVVDGDGVPVADVTVRALSGRGPGNAFAQTITGADGRFSLDDLAKGSHDIQASSATGREGATKGIEAGATGVEVVLRGAGRIDGALVGFTHPPTVYAHRDEEWRERWSAKVDGTRFTIVGLPGPHRYVVNADGEGEIDIAHADIAPGETARVTLTSRGRAHLTGRVVELGTQAPIAGARCQLDGLSDDQTVVRWAHDSVTSDAHGIVEFGEVSAGRSHVECMMSGADPWSIATSVSLAPGASATVEIPALQIGAHASSVGVSLVYGRFDGEIGDVTPGSPAERAGIAKGDLIVAVDGTVTDGFHPAMVELLLERQPPGSLVRVTVRRGDDVRTVELVTGAPAVTSGGRSFVVHPQ